MANISFNPSLMTAPQNSFQLQTEGVIQGLAQDDWVTREWLLAALVASTVTIPIWGGMGVLLNNASPSPSGQGGGPVPVAAPASTTQINGFTVFDQAINMIQTPGNTVAVAVANQNVAVYQFGSKARIPLPLASGVLASLEGASVNESPIYWDTANYNLTLTSSSSTVELPTTVKIWGLSDSARVVSYNSTTGAVTWTTNQDAAVLIL